GTSARATTKRRPAAWQYRPTAAKLESAPEQYDPDRTEQRAWRELRSRKRRPSFRSGEALMPCGHPFILRDRILGASMIDHSCGRAPDRPAMAEPEPSRRTRSDPKRK